MQRFIGIHFTPHSLAVENDEAFVGDGLGNIPGPGLKGQIRHPINPTFDLLYLSGEQGCGTGLSERRSGQAAKASVDIDPVPRSVALSQMSAALTFAGQRDMSV